MLHEINFEAFIDDTEVLVEAELILYPAIHSGDSDWDDIDGYDIFSFRVYFARTKKLAIVNENEVLRLIDNHIRNISITKIMLDNESF